MTKYLLWSKNKKELIGRAEIFTPPLSEGAREEEVPEGEIEECPFCGETGIKQLHEGSDDYYVFLCGYSGTEDKVITKCQNTKKS